MSAGKVKKGYLSGAFRKALLVGSLGISTLGLLNCTSMAGVKAARTGLTESQAEAAMAACDVKFTNHQVYLEKQEGKIDPRQMMALRKQLKSQWDVCKSKVELAFEKKLAEDPEKKLAERRARMERERMRPSRVTTTTSSSSHYEYRYGSSSGYSYQSSTRTEWHR